MGFETMGATMKRFLLATAAIFLTVPAFAADMRAPVKAPPAPVVTTYSWSGFYVGAHAGGGWSERCFTLLGVTEGCHDADGWLAGGQLGFNFQSGQFVFGVEFSGSWTDINGSHAALAIPADSYHSDIDSILLFTGRVGLAFDRLLLYVTGGAAWVRDEFRYVSPAVGTASIDQSRTGWTIGAGLEYGLASNWSIAAQYNFVDLGDRDITFGAPFVPFTVGVERELHLATVRLNYRFSGWGGAPVAARY
jgi:outer membrane immunogenic protein